MSPFLQELVVFTGKNYVFEDGSDRLSRLAGVEVTVKRIERLPHSYGELLEHQVAQEKARVPPAFSFAASQANNTIEQVLTREGLYNKCKSIISYTLDDYLTKDEKMPVRSGKLLSSNEMSMIGKHQPRMNISKSVFKKVKYCHVNSPLGIPSEHVTTGTQLYTHET